jgi:CIC family chloride channel protein
MNAGDDETGSRADSDARRRWPVAWDRALWVAGRVRGSVGSLVLSRFTGPLDLQILGRTLLHTALVGLAAGLVGSAFFSTLEIVQHVLLEGLAGYTPLRAHGELAMENSTVHTFRPWVLLLLPAAGALISGVVSLLAPETRGGGGDAMIHAFHHQGGVIRRRVIWVKALASIFTLGSGGSGGREGPTMQIGGALGSWVGSLLKVSARERRILMVAGVAAGISAVFRTPLGAALLAVESLYSDDFEAEALVPAILASVVAYSVVTSIYGESTLLAHAAHQSFVPSHLPLYGTMALLLALLAMAFLRVLKMVQHQAEAARVPVWAKPALGGLGLGILAVPLILFLGPRLGGEGQGLGILGGGYGAAQVAITGASALPLAWRTVEILALLGFAKMLGSALTIGSGGSAGDFAPSMALGAIFGGAFGNAAALLFHDPRIDPGAFALVGMGTFYAGLAKVPLSGLILVSELAGSYELLVPLMLAEAVALVVLHGRTLYEAQVRNQRESPVHRRAASMEALVGTTVGHAFVRDARVVALLPSTSAEETIARWLESPHQDVFPVCDGRGELQGILTADALRFASSPGRRPTWSCAGDLMQPAVAVKVADDLRQATEVLLANGLREVPVVDDVGKLLGMLDEAEITRFCLTLPAAAVTPADEP